MACRYEPKIKFKIKGLRSSRSNVDREGPELRVSSEGVRVRDSRGAFVRERLKRPTTMEGVVVATWATRNLRWFVSLK